MGEPPIEEAMLALDKELELGFDVVACIGASSNASFVADLLGKAHQRGIPTVEINPGESVGARPSHVRLPVSPAEGIASVFERVEMPQMLAN
jgi:NAD-dependent deacetylase